MVKKIETIEEFNQLVNEEKDFFLLKHSLTCPISSAAYQEYEKFAEQNPAVQAVYLAVQEARLLSNEIAERFGIKHESPQALLFSNGEAKWNTSHWKITVSSLESASGENQ